LTAFFHENFTWFYLQARRRSCGVVCPDAGGQPPLTCPLMPDRRTLTMKRAWAQFANASISLFFFSGCACVMTHTQQSPEGKGPYSGVRADGWLLGHPNSVGDAVFGHISPAIVMPLALIDLPLSAGFDTFLLPIDLTYDPKASKRKRRSEPNNE